MAVKVARERTEKPLLRILTAWEKSTHTLDYLLHKEFRHSFFTPVEKARITDQCATWARGRGAARYLLETCLPQGLASVPDLFRLRLEATICQLLWGERRPKAVLISSAVEGIKTQYNQTFAGLANAVLRRLATDPLTFPAPQPDLLRHLSAVYSHPEWIVQRWLNRWGEEHTRAQLIWDNRRPNLWLHGGGMQVDQSQALQILAEADIKTAKSAEFPGYFRLLDPFFPKAHALVSCGDFHVQDPSASLAVDLLNPQPGERILDLCAAPGGKTVLMAQRTGDQAEIIAVDVSADRLDQLHTTLRSSRFTSVRTLIADSRSLIPEIIRPESCDAILLDTPCSGLGVLNRRADLRWRRQPADLATLTVLQMELLESAARLVRPGGRIAYSTCTIEPEENGGVVRNFLQKNKRFTWGSVAASIPEKYLIGPAELATFSPRDGIDGIYTALIQKSN